jgi:hypothetical protein
MTFHNLRQNLLQIPVNRINRQFPGHCQLGSIPLLALVAFVLAGCGSKSGESTPPPEVGVVTTLVVGRIARLHPAGKGISIWNPVEVTRAVGQQK